MNVKKIAMLSGVALAVCGAGFGITYYLKHKDPRIIQIDAGILDGYAGHYIFRDNYQVTIKSSGDRLTAAMPERAPIDLFPAATNLFFHKGHPERWSFHQDSHGKVDSALIRFKNGDEEQAEKVNAFPPNPEGTNGLIAATTGGWAAEAGLQILKEGGTAVDAAIATAICQVVHAGGSYVSFAGPLMMVYYDAATEKVYYLDAEYATPLGEKNPQSIPRTGGRTALVPGFFSGVEVAHERFGKLPFARLFEKAIAVADNGEPVSAVMEWWINSKKGVLGHYPETKKIFTKADGQFLSKGDVFRQPALAETLRQVAAQGAKHIYEGEWAQHFVSAVQNAGGTITSEDLKSYGAYWEEPLRSTFRDYTVYATGPTPRDGANIIQALNLIELADLKKFGQYTKSPECLYWLMQINGCLAATREQAREIRISKANAASIWQQMTNGTWSTAPGGMHAYAKNSPHTDGLVVVDRWGNVVALNHTINTVLWGNTGLFVDGISIPDSAAFQGRDIARAGPGHRLPNDMSPLIICRDGKPVLGSAAVGGGLHSKTLQVLFNILECGMTPQDAVDVPAFIGWNPGEVETDTFEPAMLEGLKNLGLKVHVLSTEKANMSRGYWAGAQIDSVTGRIRGGTSRGLPSAVLAY